MDARGLAYRMEGKAHKPSRKYRKLLCQEPFLSRSGDRPAQVLDWCRWFAREGYGRLGLPPSKGGDPFEFQCLGYELGLFDFNLMMRFGLQFGFVMRAVSRLGTDNQQFWLERIASMEAVTCLAMTEEAHGSNVRALQTCAEYHPETDGFVLDNTAPGAGKVWVSSAESSDLCLAFAQLRVAGSSHGVHAFLVPLRGPGKALCPGIRIESMGESGGLSGLKYHRLTFEQVQIGREQLLSRHAELDRQGRYRCHLKSPGHRLNALLGTLVVGRGLLSSGAAAGAKLSLSLAVRYSVERRQFRSPGEILERKLLSHQAHQKALMPHLATLVVVDAARRTLAHEQHDYFEDSLKDRKLETFTSSLKAYTSAFAVETARVCRECCGGSGCLAENRLTGLCRDLDLFTTMEGDNRILNLMVARNLLTDYQRGLDRSRLLSALNWAGKSVDLAARTSLSTRKTTPEEINSRNFFDKALRYRVESLRFSLARRVRARLEDGLDVYDALADCQDHCLALAHAYCEEKIYRCLRNLIESSPPGWDRRLLERCLALYALSRIEADRGWFLEQGYLNARQSRTIRNEVLSLSAEMAEDALTIVEAFELPTQWIACPMLEMKQDAG
ncbi:MAG: acyl-CoA dehydrogenase [Vulcanimicrobiota bacterium]